MPKTINVEYIVRTYREMVADKGKGVTAKAYDTAREWMVDVATEGEHWYEYIYEMWKKALEQIGFIEPELQFSGFWSQGDGASFTCKYVDCELLLRFLSTERPATEVIEPTEDGEDFRGYLLHKCGYGNGMSFNHRLDWLAEIATNHLNGEVVRTESHYSHYNTCDFQVEDHSHNRPEGSPIYDVIEAFQTDGEELREAISKALYKALEEEYYSVTDDEQLIEFAEANEWTFDESGQHRTA